MKFFLKIRGGKLRSWLMGCALFIPCAVHLIGAALGRTLTFQELPPEHVRKGMLAQGLPEEVPDRLLGSLADYAHRPGPTTSTVADLLGRPARTFADWAHDNATAFDG